MKWTKEMGRVLTEIDVVNLKDEMLAQSNVIPANQIRRINIKDALVDTGATLLALPKSSIQQLGLEKQFTKRVRSILGSSDVDFFGPVRLTIQGRECPLDVMEVPDGNPALVGQIPLEYLDFVVDPSGQRLIGNPAHGGEHMFEAY